MADGGIELNFERGVHDSVGVNVLNETGSPIDVKDNQENEEDDRTDSNGQFDSTDSQKEDSTADSVEKSDSVIGPNEKDAPGESQTPTSGGTLHLIDGAPVRGLWDHRHDFFFSCLGYTAGLSCLWRFPYLVYKYGGGAFMLPYVFFMLTIGIPLLYLEMSFGQYVSQGTTRVWQMAPLFGGLGYAMVALSFVVATYYNVVVSWFVYYLVACMSPTLPWSSCNNSWNSDNCCQSRIFVPNCTNIASIEPQDDISCFFCIKDINYNYSWSIHNSSTADSQTRLIDLFGTNRTVALHTSNDTAVAPSEEYFHNEVLGLTEDIEDMGTVQWRLVLSLIVAWCLVFACVSCGTRTSGKVVYVTSVLPFVFLVGLLAKCSLLDGAREGILSFLHPRWEILRDGMVWREAASQVLFTLGPCYGNIITLSSYNSFTYNFYRVATLVPILSTLASVMSGSFVFICLGHLSWRLHSPIENIVTSNLGLAFIAYPEAVATEHPAVTAFFFLLLIFMAVDSLVPYIHTIMSAILDQQPKLQEKPRYTTFVALGVCGVLLLCGLPLTTKGGLYLIQLLDSHVVFWPAYLIGAFECLLVTWLYGFVKVQNNIWVMIGKRPGQWWKFMWGIITPVLLIGLLVYTIVVYHPLSYRGTHLPESANIASWVLASVTIVIMLIYALYALIVTPGSFNKRWKSVLRPPKRWGPSGKFADFLSQQFWTLPEHMVSVKEETIQHPTVWKRRNSIATTSDGELESISTMEGILTSPLGAQHGDNIDTGSVQWSEDENKVRGNWSGRLDFLFAGLGYSVGIGNVWRFPYIVYKNGGGSFFLPYLLMLMFCGLPLVYMELVLGQFSSLGPITVWRLSPIFKGVGYAAVVTSMLVCVYYNVFAAWSVYYVAASMTSVLPWTSCNNTWNTPRCRERSFYNQTFCRPGADLNVTDSLSFTTNVTTDFAVTDMPTSNLGNETNTTCSRAGHHYTSPSSEYFFHKVLMMSGGIDEPGQVQWALALCLLFCWIITFVGLIKGVKSAGKLVYATVLIPYIILVMLLIRFVTLDTDAHLDGIKYYVTPQWETLGKAGVWGDAASQLFFSLGLCMGGLTALGSYNRFHYNCFKDAYLICCIDTVTSVFAGFVIFAILGVMAREQETTVDHVVESSFALAFIAYPDAVTRLPGSSAWSILFFLMMFFLAVDTHFLMMETIVIAVMDEFSKYLWKKRVLIIFVLCLVMYLLGLAMVTQGGVYLLVLVDAHVASWSPLVIGILMCVSISWVYKIDNFGANIKSMLGSEPRWWWKLMWKIATPCILLFILLFSWIMYTPATMDSYVYPLWAQILGVIMSLTPILCIPIVFMVQLFTAETSPKQTVLDLQRSHSEWGPALEKYRLSCFLPGMVNQEETMARIAQWVVTGSNSMGLGGDVPFGEPTAIDLSQQDLPTISQQEYDCLRTIADDSSVVGSTLDVQRKWSRAAKMVLEKLHTPKEEGQKSDIKLNTPQDKKKHSKLRVRFPNEEDTISDLSTNTSRPIKRVRMVEKGTQTGQRMEKLQNLINVKADLHHSYENPSFESDEGALRREEVLQNQSSPQSPNDKPAMEHTENQKSDEADSGISSTYLQQDNRNTQRDRRKRKLTEEVVDNDTDVKCISLSKLPASQMRPIATGESHISFVPIIVSSPESFKEDLALQTSDCTTGHNVVGQEKLCEVRETADASELGATEEILNSGAADVPDSRQSPPHESVQNVCGVPVTAASDSVIDSVSYSVIEASDNVGVTIEIDETSQL